MSEPPGPVPPGPELPPTPGASAPVPAYPYAPRMPGSTYEPPPSKRMAGWALALSIVPCCAGLTTLVGLALGITVLVKSRDGRDHGKGMAIAAVVIAGLWLVVGVVAVVLGVVQELAGDADRDESGQVTSRGDISVNKVREGDCLDYPALAGDEKADDTTVTAVPCAEPHQFEAYHEFRLEGSSYPGEEEVWRQADLGCFGAFRDFVGRPYPRSQFETSYLYPTATSWRVLDDRSIICLLGTPGEELVGSMEGSRR